MINRILIFVSILTLPLTLHSQNSSQSNNIQEHIKYLASDLLAGRVAGTLGDTLSIEYIKKELLSYGFKPYFSSPVQEFDIIDTKKVSESSNFKIKGINPVKDKDYYIPSYSASFRGKLIITTLSTDSAEKIDGAVIIDIPLDSVRFLASKYSDLGAKAILVTYSNSEEISRLSNFGGSSIAIPVIFITKDLASEISKYKRPEILIDISINIKKIRTGNVVMKLQPDNSKGEIIIGAHYDHLGMGVLGSRTPSRKEVHNGADDNASGIASILEIARLISQKKDSLKSTIVIAAFSAEERGLIGSKKFADSLKNLNRIPQLMINLDMVGRLRDNKLQVGGVGTFKDADSIIRSINKSYNFELALTKSGVGSSDHSSFYSISTPVLFIHTGTHQEYHTPDDDIELINIEGQSKITDFVLDVIEKIAYGYFSPQFTKSDSSQPEGGRATVRISIGVVPDFTYEAGDGFKIGAVTEGRPAAKAGLISGDIINEINGKSVKNIYDYMSRLNELKRGDVVEIKVIRDKNEIILRLEL